MSEENVNASGDAGNAASADAAKAVSDKVSQYSGKVDGFIEGLLGFIGNRPWDSWLRTANGCITKFLPAVIALAGVLAFATGLVTMIKNDFPFSWVVKLLFVLIPVVFAMHLAPKALALMRSFIENGEPEVIRPELMYIMKVVYGLGGLILGVYLLLNFESDLVVPAIVSIVFAVLMTICLGRPETVGVKAGYPANCVEEIIALFMFPIRVVVALMTPLIGLAVVGGVVYGVVEWFDDGLASAISFIVSALLPFVLPLAVYFAYLLTAFVLDFYKAIVSVPRKLDELKDK